MSYDITFGYLGDNKEKTATIISEKLNIKLLPTSGGNFGYRFGEIADTISVIDNYLDYDDWWQEENYKNCPILIKASFTNGKNKDKEEKARHIREVLKIISDLIEIKHEIIED
ncbi:hypothetical protein OIU80_16390 [Flavobacterium sp. LS1R47]|uniref:Uncharacterized protein n=1 Tax=Flavobacterium frigoritolerans TaxID=2987686 RepID=A0A9X3HN00_9FLAO|nr:hypothetical protein [Flavobacterium frigoritolerans]MCV9933863.1 hypothetical protein [Flavobacterium frigoritolerans]